MSANTKETNMMDAVAGESLSRRSFLTGTAIAGSLAVAALAGCAPAAPSEELAQSGNASADGAAAPSADAASGDAPAWLGAAPEIAEDEIVETVETGMLIVGAGNAGMAAAYKAWEMNEPFILCEKGETQGMSRYFVGAVNSFATEKAGTSIEKGKLLNEMARYASFKCRQATIRTWLDESADMIEWIASMAAEHGIEPRVDADITHPEGGTGYYVAPTEHLFRSEDGMEWFSHVDFAMEKLQAEGCDIRLQHTLVKLEREGGGRVTGGIFETKDGYKRIQASKGVLLATGGYGSNDEMVQALNPMVGRCVTVNGCHPNATGEGIKAGLWVGAARDTEPAAMIFDRGNVEPGVAAGYDDGGLVINPMAAFKYFGSMPFLKVDMNGRRFANESTPYDFICHAAATHKNGTWCSIFDANYREDVNRFKTIGCSKLVREELAAADIETAFADDFEEGRFFKADTLEELAGYLGLPADELQKTVDRYNELFDKQVDEDFGKEPYRLSAIRQAPFYGSTFGGCLLTTLDGLAINEDMQVLDGNDEVIEGLYAAGDCSGSVFSGNYPEYIVGCAVGRTMTFGRHAVAHMAQA